MMVVDIISDDPDDEHLAQSVRHTSCGRVDRPTIVTSCPRSVTPATSPRLDDDVGTLRLPPLLSPPL